MGQHLIYATFPMARKPALTIDKLTDLGPEKLTQLVLIEAERNTGFRRQVKAALAGKSGPEAVAKLIDRRLSGLERAKSFVDWVKARAFRDDLRSLTDNITSELGPAAPVPAIDRLLRFIATHEQVFERVDDSSGSIQDVYYLAIAAAGDLAQNLTGPEADLLPNKIMARLGESTHGYLSDLTEAVAPHLPPETLVRWDADLAAAIEQRHATEAEHASDHWSYSMTSQWAEMRQTIASARGDIDLLIAIEANKPAHTQDTLGIAERLLDAGRATEALDWVRRPGQRTFDGLQSDMTPKRVSLEAQIFDVLGDKPAAQSLRWRCFEASLCAEILRDYLKHLPEFEDIEAEERAYKLALGHANPETALQFFLAWPRLDLAAELIVTHRHGWDGHNWHVLPKVARLLEHEHPLAATILYRALLDDILASARSKAYSHGAKYLNQLASLASDADKAQPSGMADHQTYFTGLKKAHPRKTGFWARIDELDM